jgi:hypothetical protein
LYNHPPTSEEESLCVKPPDLQDKELERRPRPWLAVLITVVLLALAVQSQLKTGSIDPELLGALVVLALFWAGQAIDYRLPFR